MFQEYLNFLGLSSTIYIVPIAMGVAAAVLMWIDNRKIGAALGLAVGVSVGVYLLRLLSPFCMQVSVPEWWPTVCIVVGWIIGIVFFFGAIAAIDWDVEAVECVTLVFFGATAGYVTRYALQWLLGPYLIFPLIKYVVGYFVYILAPVALLVLWIVVVVILLRPSFGLRCFLIPFLYIICLTVFLLAEPVLMEHPKTYFGEALTAVAPCALAIVVLGIKRSFKILLFCMVFLYSWVAALLLRSLRIDPTVNQIGLFLLSPPVVVVFCLVLAGLFARHVHRLTKHRHVMVEETPLWVVVMPWVSLIPAFYFAKLGIGSFLLFALANIFIGLWLIAGFASQVGSFKNISGEADRDEAPIDWRAGAALQSDSFKFTSRKTSQGKGTIDRRARIRWFSRGHRR